MDSPLIYLDQLTYLNDFYFDWRGNHEVGLLNKLLYYPETVNLKDSFVSPCKPFIKLAFFFIFSKKNVLKYLYIFYELLKGHYSKLRLYVIEVEVLFNFCY